MPQSQEEFLRMYTSEAYEKPSITVDVALFTIRNNTLQVLMIRRNQHPYAGQLALPGVFVGITETLDAAAARALQEKTGLPHVYLEQLYTWGAPDRDPRMRIISVSYYALVPEQKISASTGIFCPVEELLHSQEIAFDHRQIVEYGLSRIRNKVRYTDIAFSLVGEEFTLPELQRIYEILLGQPLYKANFRKKIAGCIQATEKYTSGTQHRPSRIYRRKSGK